MGAARASQLKLCAAFTFAQRQRHSRGKALSRRFHFDFGVSSAFRIRARELKTCEAAAQHKESTCGVAAAPRRFY